MTLDLKMKRYVIAICSLVLLCGCNKQYRYTQGVDHAADLIEKGISGTNPISLTNDPVVIPSDLVTPLPENSDIAYLPFPYTLHDRKRVKHGYEWQVRQDVSGMFRNAGKLRLYGKDNALIVDAPNDVVEAFVIKTLELDSPTTKSTVPSEGAPSDVQ